MLGEVHKSGVPQQHLERDLRARRFHPFAGVSTCPVQTTNLGQRIGFPAFTDEDLVFLKALAF